MTAPVNPLQQIMIHAANLLYSPMQINWIAPTIRRGPPKMQYTWPDAKPVKVIIKEEKDRNIVDWAEIIGLEDAKDSLRAAIEEPYLNKEIYEAFKIQPAKGVLLYGPPGCGKTMLGKAAATAMARVHNKPFKDGFKYLNGGEILGRYFDSETRWMMEAFDFADKFKQENGYPAVLFFDEADSALPARESTNIFNKAAVNIFLSRMDGMKELSAFVILATNDHGELDEAATRPGRIDRKIYVGRPQAPAVKSMLHSYLKKKPLACDLDEAVELACLEIFKESRLAGTKPFYKRINGATVSGIVDQAATIAFQNALHIKKSTGNINPTDLGVGKKHILAAIDLIHKETEETKKKAVKKRPNPFQYTTNIESSEEK